MGFAGVSAAGAVAAAADSVASAGWAGWSDYPDADLNFSHRLQQLTSMKANPDARVLKLTSPDLADYPFIYREHIERLALRPAKINALRQYLSNGGVLLVNDFLGVRWTGRVFGPR